MYMAALVRFAYSSAHGTHHLTHYDALNPFR